jgi:hypothetical protein
LLKMPLGAALEAVSARNSAIITAYRDGAHRFISRSISSLILSMTEQRREFGKELAVLADLPGLKDAETELEIESFQLELPGLMKASEACGLLPQMQVHELADYELLAALAGATVALSTDAAERLAALAEQARKRASWVQDHLDLLGIC